MQGHVQVIPHRHTEPPSGGRSGGAAGTGWAFGQPVYLSQMAAVVEQTAGVDFALIVAARLAGEDVAKAIQLGIEYDPAPPFASGHPDVADPALVAKVREQGLVPPN